MADRELIRSRCPFCDRGIGVRPEQMGRRVRCPACGRVFEVGEDRPWYEHQADPGPAPAAGAIEPHFAPAGDAYEVVESPPPPARPWPKAKITARLKRDRALAFQAAVQAVRSGACQVVQLDWANSYLRFALAAPGDDPTDHDLYAYDLPDGTSEVEVTSRAPNDQGRFDPLYEALVREVEKYLMFAAPPPPPALPPRRSGELEPRRYDDYEPPRRRRRFRRCEGDASLGIAGFVCGLVGLLLFCLWFLGGPLGLMGVVFGAIGMSKQKGRGFAVAGLILGSLACLLSLFWLVVILAADAGRERSFR